MPGAHASATGIQPGLPTSPAADALDLPIVENGLHALRHRVAAHAQALGLSRRRVAQLMVVASELATNAIRHGGGTGRLILWRHGPALYCQVRDHGPGIADPKAGSTPPDLAASQGRGLWICRQLTTDVTIGRTDDRGDRPGTTVTAVMPIGASHHTDHPHTTAGHSDHAGSDHARNDHARSDHRQPRPAHGRDARQDHHTDQTSQHSRHRTR